MPTLTLTVLGNPMGKGAAQTNRTTGATFNTTRTAEWMGAARSELARQLPRGWRPLDEPVAAFLTAVFKRPKSGPNRFRKRAHPTDNRTRYAQKPDADNVSKIVLDSCTHAELWRDDALVDVAVRRVWQGREGDPPRVELFLVWGDELAELVWAPDALEAW